MSALLVLLNAPPPRLRGAPCVFDDWHPAFITQLEEVCEADQATLARLSHCVRVLTWGERVAAVPAAWFATLAGSPHLCRLADLPFDASARQHLQGCPACLEEVYLRLQARALLRWEVLCPSVEELTAWLEAQIEDLAVETHVAGCGLCQDTVQWQAGLWKQEGLLSAVHIHAKLAAAGIGLAEPDAVVWLTTAIAWQPLQSIPAQAMAVKWGVLLAITLGRVVRLALPTSQSGGAHAMVLDEVEEKLVASLEAGEPVTNLAKTSFTPVRK